MVKIYTTNSSVNCGPSSFINLTNINADGKTEMQLSEEGRLKPFNISMYSSFLIWGNKYNLELVAYTSSTKLDGKMFDLMFKYESVPVELQKIYQVKAKKTLSSFNKKFFSKVRKLENPINKLNELLDEGNRVAIFTSSFYMGRESVPHWVVAYGREGDKYSIACSKMGEITLSKKDIIRGFKLNKTQGFSPALVSYKKPVTKILAIGDFHGKFPVKLKKLAKDVDLVVSVGDYFPWSLKKEFFKHCYKENKELWEIVGRKKFKESKLKDLKTGEQRVISFLDKLKVPVIAVPGNYDTPEFNDHYAKKSFSPSSWEWGNRDFFSPIIKRYKNIRRIDYSYFEFGDLVFIGGFGHSSPGNVKSVAYKKYRKRLDKLFKKFSRKNKKGTVIFIGHNMPYDTKLDLIRDKKANKKARGRHFGSKLIQRIIKSYQPTLFVGGHFHENQGKDKIGKTTIINTGSAGEGKAALIDFDEKRGRIKSIKFVK